MLKMADPFKKQECALRKKYCVIFFIYERLGVPSARCVREGGILACMEEGMLAIFSGSGGRSVGHCLQLRVDSLLSLDVSSPGIPAEGWLSGR